jgi:predicted RNase H-like HicB family nuclease
MASKKIIATVKTRYGSYACVFERDFDTGEYIVEARGVQGALSQGKTLAHAKRMIAESIEGAIEARIILNAQRQGTVRFVRKPRMFA